MLDAPPLPFGPWWEVFGDLVGGRDDFPLMPAALVLSQILQGGDSWPGAEAELRSLGEEVEHRCHESQLDDPRDRVHVIFEVLHDRGFGGDTEQYRDPENSFIDRVLQRRRGLPITLSVLAIHLGHCVDVPIYGIGFPGHFIVGFNPGGPESSPTVLDPFRGGRVLDSRDLGDLALRVTGQREGWQHYLQPATSGQVVSRMLRNLVSHLGRERRHQHVAAAERLLQIAKGEH